MLKNWRKSVYETYESFSYICDGIFSALTLGTETEQQLGRCLMDGLKGLDGGES